MSFAAKYTADNERSAQSQDTAPLVPLEPVARGIVDFMSRNAGLSFNRGVYRVHALADMANWTAIVAEAFPDYRNRIRCFSYDWLGRHFAIDLGRREESQCLILLLEPGTGQTLEIPATFEQFHDGVLVEYSNDALADKFFHAWLASGGAAPDMTQCVGYKKPLFLNGDDEVSNLELNDMDVYWSICGQLLAKIRNLPDGTRIGNVGMG